MNKQKYNPDSGFTLLEVLLSIVVVTFFTAAAMQLIVISTAFKARAKELTTATNLIQQNLESIRDKANSFEFPKLGQAINYDPNNPVTTIQLSGFANEDFQTNQEVQFEGKADFYTISSVNTTNSQITLSSAITESIASGTALVNNSLCNGGLASGLGNALKQKTATDLTTIPSSLANNFSNYQAVTNYSPYTIPNTGIKVWMIRQDTVPDRNPHDVLQVKYVVVKDKNQDGNPDPDQILAEFSTEVMPNASFQCFKL